MFEIFVPDPELSLMDGLDAFREGFQGRTLVEKGSHTMTEGIHYSFGFTVQA